MRMTHNLPPIRIRHKKSDRRESEPRRTPGAMTVAMALGVALLASSCGAEGFEEQRRSDADGLLVFDQQDFDFVHGRFFSG